MASRGKLPRTVMASLRWKRFRPAIRCLEVWNGERRCQWHGVLLGVVVSEVGEIKGIREV